MEKISYNFKNRTAIVTGGAQGFGLDIAKRFLKSEAKVIIWDLDPKAIEKATKEMNNSNLSSKIVDVSNFKDVENAKIALEKAKEVGHDDEVFEKLAANIELLRGSKTESETA